MIRKTLSGVIMDVLKVEPDYFNDLMVLEDVSDLADEFGVDQQFVRDTITELQAIHDDKRALARAE